MEQVQTRTANQSFFTLTVTKALALNSVTVIGLCVVIMVAGMTVGVTIDKYVTGTWMDLWNRKASLESVID